MIICHVIPKGRGGSILAADEISQGDKRIYCNVAGYLGFFRSFYCMLKLWLTKADIANFHNPMPAFFYLTFPHSKKVIFTSHGSWVGFFMAKPPEGPFGKLKASFLIATSKFVINNSDAVIAVSNRVKDIIAQSSLPRKITVIHNGVDTEKFKPAKKRGKMALWIGDNPNLKGFREAVKIARKRSVKLLAVGISGENTDYIEYIQNVPSEKMPEIYRRCFLLIYPSKWEGHPLVPLEAMASGLDIIASRESNIELLPLKNGCFAASGKLARKIAEKNTWYAVRNKYRKFYSEFMLS